MTLLRSVTVLLCALSVGVVSADEADPLRGFDAFVEQARRDYGVPGVSVAVVQADKVVFLKGYGVRHAGESEPVDEHTLFMAASVTKTFTAALAAIFVEEGKLTWDGHVIDVLPEMVLFDEYATRYATLRDFLSHRSGLPAFGGDLLEKQGYPRPEVLRRLRYLPPGCSFRERAGYSNPGFMIAGMATERAAGIPWEQLIRDRLFDPLGMRDSGVSTDDWKTSENYAAAHLVSADGFDVVPWEKHDILAPAGSITTTAADLAQWVRLQLGDGSLNGKQVLSAAALAEMHTPAMVETPSFSEAPPIDENCGFSYGLGWNIYHYAGHQIVEKGGARAGMRSVVMLIPDLDVGVAVLANRNLTFLPEAIRGWILEAYTGQTGTDLQSRIRKTGERVDAMFAEKPPATTDGGSPSRPLKDYAGTYSNDLYGPLEIMFDQGRLTWKTGPAAFGGDVEHVGFDNFLLIYPPGNIALPEPAFFTIDAQGKCIRLSTETFGVFSRVDSEND